MQCATFIFLSFTVNFSDSFIVIRGRKKWDRKFCFPSKLHSFVHPLLATCRSIVLTFMWAAVLDVCLHMCSQVCLVHTHTHTIWLGTRYSQHCSQPETSLFAGNTTWTSSDLSKVLFREIVFPGFEFGILKSYMCIIFDISPGLFLDDRLEMQPLH